MSLLGRKKHRQLNPFGPCHRCGAHGLYPATAFRAAIEREKHRADRNSHVFSIAIFPLPADAEEALSSATITAVLASRVRCTDEVGWIGEKAIGTLLPETHGPGAWLFTEKVLRTLAEESLASPARVYTYPARAAAEKKDDGRQMWFNAFASPPSPPHHAPTDSAYPEFQPFDRYLPSNMPDSAAAHANEPLLEEWLEPPPSRWKRGLDVLGSSAALLLVGPLMLLIAWLVRSQSPGPVLFRQKRVGYLGKTFECLKFRTMHLHADQQAHQKHFETLMQKDTPMTKLDAMQDPRLIPVGRVLRVTGLDELPQLFNVLRGEMSLIGPRPCIPYEFEKYERWHRRRVDAMPGITGLWQVSGKNRTTFSEMMRLDIAYARRNSVWLDLGILFRTLPALLGQVLDERRRKRKTTEAEPSPAILPAGQKGVGSTHP